MKLPQYSAYISKDTLVTIMPSFISRFRSPKTRYNYALAVSDFADWLKKDPLLCTDDDAGRYAEWLAHEQSLGALTRDTVRTRLSVMKSFFNFY
nr:phage integrase N-terminal SAM-like domain-containing protein [Lachnospiraceae bacterium]